MLERCRLRLRVRSPERRKELAAYSAGIWPNVLNGEAEIEFGLHRNRLLNTWLNLAADRTWVVLIYFSMCFLPSIHSRRWSPAIPFYRGAGKLRKSFDEAGGDVNLQPFTRIQHR